MARFTFFLLRMAARYVQWRHGAAVAALTRNGSFCDFLSDVMAAHRSAFPPNPVGRFVDQPTPPL